MSKKTESPEEKLAFIKLKLIDAKRELNIRKEADGDSKILETLRLETPDFWKHKGINYKKELKKGTLMSLKLFKDQYLKNYVNALIAEKESIKNIKQEEKKLPVTEVSEEDAKNVNPLINPQGYVKSDMSHMNCVNPLVNPWGFVKSQSPLSSKEKINVTMGIKNEPAPKTPIVLNNTKKLQIKHTAKKKEFDELKKPKLRRLINYVPPPETEDTTI